MSFSSWMTALLLPVALLGFVSALRALGTGRIGPARNPVLRAERPLDFAARLLWLGALLPLLLAAFALAPKPGFAATQTWFALFVWWILVRGLLTGRIGPPGRLYARREKPLAYWLMTLGAGAAAALMSLHVWLVWTEPGPAPGMF